MRILSRGLPALAAAAALAISCAACGSTPAHTATGSTATGSTAPATPTVASGFPVTIAAANGTVHVGSRPARIVSLSPTVTEMLYAIGAGGQVTAVDADSSYPPQAPRTKLSGLQPNIEAIVADKPDLVVESYDYGKLTKKLAAFNIPVLELPAPSKLSGVYREFDQLGRATGHLAAAEHEDASMRAQISQIVASVPHHAHPVTYYYELDQTYYSVTSSTFVGRLLGLLGMKSIADAAKGAAAAGGYPQLSAGYILKANPDYIILADTICCHQSTATVTKRAGWSTLAAVKEHHVIALNDNIASRWGPRIPKLLRAVAAGISGSGG